MRSTKHRSSVLALLAGLAVGPICPAALAQEEDLSDAEKTKVRDLLRLMFSMQCESDHPHETLEGCLDQGNENPAEYDKVPGLGGAPAAVRIKRIISHYNSMLGQNRLRKDGRNAGGTTKWKGGGIDDDKVVISKRQLELWCDPNASPRDRAKAKFWIMGTLANEAAHVVQKPMPLDTQANDRRRCDAERDSDALTIKFLNGMLDRMTNAAGDPHTSLAGIRAEGATGERLANCLESMGVDTEAEIADVHKDLKERRDTYKDRKENLFENSIANDRSWRLLYYGRQYRSPLALRKDFSNFNNREITVTYGDNSTTIRIPNDRKIPIAVFCTIDSQSRIILIVVTLDPRTGIPCIHTWTDTDADGLPEDAPHSVELPEPPSGPRDIPMVPGDVAMIEGVADGLGFTHGYMLHDRLNGILTAVETNEDFLPTGRAVEMFRDPLIAAKELNPDAGDFFEVELDRTMFDGAVEVVFKALPHAGSLGDCAAAIGVFDPDVGFGKVFPGFTAAEAIAPLNVLGINQLPLDPTVPIIGSGNPGEVVLLESVGLGGIELLFAQAADHTGLTPEQLIPLPPRPYDVVRVRSNQRPDTVEHVWSLLGFVQDQIDADLNRDGAPDLLAMTSEPTRMVMFLRDPAFPDVLMPGAEIVVENPGVFAFGQSANIPGGLTLESLQASTELTILSQDVQPLLFQTLIDLDADGSADDALAVLRDPFQPEFIALTMLDVGGNNARFTGFVPLPGVDPVAIDYADLDNDADLDAVVTSADGTTHCLVNLSDGTMAQGDCAQPCPADLDGDGDVDADDFFRYLDLFAQRDPSADLDGDGDVDADDFFTYLDLFAQGC